MPRSNRGRSAASRVFLALFAAAVFVGLLAAGGLALVTQRETRAEAERLTRTLASSLASSPAVTGALATGDEIAATAVLQPYANAILADGTIDFITVMTPEGTRITHPDRQALGARYLGTIPKRPMSLTEEFTGTLGPSVRTISPVRKLDATLGWVSVGVTVESLAASLVGRLPSALAVAAVIIAAGCLGAVLARRFTRRIAGDMPPGRVRDAISSYESIRTLGEALRAQTHEHGNRMHTAIALLELGRTSEAIAILAETSAQSQLLDQVTAHRHGDPTLAALLLGKASQAKERGISWGVHIDPAAPKPVLSAVDSVSVFGNLIDNALDAASEAPERWVRVTIAPDSVGVLLAVADSGSGVPEPLRDHIFEYGVSTKSADAAGRGVGLALARSLVEEAGGTITVQHSPTVFCVRLPADSTGSST